MSAVPPATFLASSPRSSGYNRVFRCGAPVPGVNAESIATTRSVCVHVRTYSGVYTASCVGKFDGI